MENQCQASASLGKEILPRRSKRFLDADQSGREEANFACFNSLDTSWIQVAQFGQAFLGKPEPGSLTPNRAADFTLMRNCLIILTHGSLPRTSLVQGHGVSAAKIYWHDFGHLIDQRSTTS